MRELPPNDELQRTRPGFARSLAAELSVLRTGQRAESLWQMNRWYFWVLAPIMLGTATGLPFIVEPPSWQGRLVTYVFCGMLVLATIGLAAPTRFRWAVKGVAATVLLAYLCYAGSEAMAWWAGKPFGFGSDRGRANLFNAVRGLLVFGIPAMYVLLRGRSGTAVDVLLGEDSGEAHHVDSGP